MLLCSYRKLGGRVYGSGIDTAAFSVAGSVEVGHRILASELGDYFRQAAREVPP